MQIGGGLAVVQTPGSKDYYAKELDSAMHLVTMGVNLLTLFTWINQSSTFYPYHSTFLVLCFLFLVIFGK